VPAKINLWLEVIRKRDDGYHELSSLMLPIGVYDRIEIALRSGEELRVKCDHDLVPSDSRNLAWKAAQALLAAAGVKTGVRIDIEKSIPVGAGLGGGSADAGAVLLGLNSLLGSPLPMERLQTLAARLGADVPFFLFRQPALARGIGERLQPVEGLPDYPLVLVKPPLTVATGWVYQSLKLTRGASSIRLSRLLASPWRLLDVMENDLETVTLSEYPLLIQIKEWLLARGALGVLMSGSGPTVFAVFSEQTQAREVEGLAREKWRECWVAATQAYGASAAGQK
jgi:4-diphosphocytidyl-2-C-methyl-D-erythritol kinase